VYQLIMQAEVVEVQMMQEHQVDLVAEQQE
jgi:hypothetical protein